MDASENELGRGFQVDFLWFPKAIQKEKGSPGSETDPDVRRMEFLSCGKCGKAPGRLLVAWFQSLRFSLKKPAKPCKLSLHQHAHLPHRAHRAHRRPFNAQKKAMASDLQYTAPSVSPRHAPIRWIWPACVGNRHITVCPAASQSPLAKKTSGRRDSPAITHLKAHAGWRKTRTLHIIHLPFHIPKQQHRDFEDQGKTWGHGHRSST